MFVYVFRAKHVYKHHQFLPMKGGMYGNAGQTTADSEP